nr:MAG TPA: hypothetical protein [Caudoviricetes sp.]
MFSFIHFKDITYIIQHTPTTISYYLDNSIRVVYHTISMANQALISINKECRRLVIILC